MPLESVAVAGVLEGLGAVETRPDGAAGLSAGLEGARTHAPWVVGSPFPGDCRRAGPRAPDCWRPPCCGLGYLWREMEGTWQDPAMLSGFLLSIPTHRSPRAIFKTCQIMPCNRSLHISSPDLY